MFFKNSYMNEQKMRQGQRKRCNYLGLFMGQQALISWTINYVSKM